MSSLHPGFPLLSVFQTLLTALFGLATYPGLVLLFAVQVLVGVAHVPSPLKKLDYFPISGLGTSPDLPAAAALAPTISGITFFH